MGIRTPDLLHAVENPLGSLTCGAPTGLSGSDRHASGRGLIYAYERAGLVEVMDADDMMPSDAQVQAAAEGRPTHPDEPHSGGTAGRLNWLRAGVLGANDGIVSVAGILIGVAGATSSRGP